MVRRKPVIGLTPGYNYSEDKAYIKNGYYEAVQKVGGIPVLLVLKPDIDLLDEMIELCDGFLLTGGPDLDAQLFGEANLKCNGEISPYRDEIEIHLARRAVELDKPLFGICRGIQVMNVALGGSIYQDIHCQIKDREIIKHSQNAPVWYATHDIVIKDNSKVYKSFDRARARVNSFHHQAVKKPAPGFVVSATAEDGMIESIEHEACSFAVGVQWHPELMWKEDSEFLNIFEMFVCAAAEKWNNK